MDLKKGTILDKVSTSRRNIGTIKPIMEMVPFPTMPRRHRIYPNEIPPIITAIHNTLTTMSPNDPETLPLFRVLWRFKTHREGRPCYPELNRETLDQLLIEVEQIIAETGY